jgi:DNA replication protein DnaC
MELMHQLTPQLKRLRLSGVLDTLELRNQQAIQEKLSYVEPVLAVRPGFLARLIQDEVERRAQPVLADRPGKQLQLRLRRANFRSDKTLESFDFSFPGLTARTGNPTINRQQVLDLATCAYVAQHRNTLICGPTGVGKSHLAQALGHEACRRGHDVLFVSTHKMLTHLNGGRADGSYDRRFQAYLRPDLLILDDFGLKPVSPPGSEDLLDVILERYERASILITSNRAPGEWPSLFGDPLMASAALDRLADNAHVLIITGSSYRARDRQALHFALPE